MTESSDPDALTFALPDHLQELSQSLGREITIFAKAYAEGEPPHQAYLLMRPDASAQVAHMQAGRLLKRPEVMRFVAALRETMLTQDLLYHVERRAILARIARDEKVEPNKRIQAILADAKLAGETDGAGVAKVSELERLAQRIRPTLGLPLRQDMTEKDLDGSNL